MPRRFKKARPGYLALYVRGGSRIVEDDEILTGNTWAKFADLGMLVEVRDEDSFLPPDAKVVSKTESSKSKTESSKSRFNIPPAPPLVEKPKEDNGGMTKSPASKMMAKATKDEKRRKGKK